MASSVGPLIFEFGTFNKATFPTPADFLARLDPFLEALPEGFRYAIEIRNHEYLSPAYFDLLGSHNVAHVFNAWTRMPALDEQAQLPGAFTADFTVVRALLTQGRGIRAGGQDLRAIPLDPGAERGRAGRHAENRPGDAESEKGCLHLRQQPAGRQRTVDDRGRGGLSRVMRCAGSGGTRARCLTAIPV